MIAPGLYATSDAGRFTGKLVVVDTRAEIGPYGMPVTVYRCRWLGQVRQFEVGDAELRRLLGLTS